MFVPFFIVTLNKVCKEYKAIFLWEADAKAFCESKGEHYSYRLVTKEESKQLEQVLKQLK